MKKAVIYVRCATRNWRSIQLQRAMCERYAAEHDMQVVAIFADIPASGNNQRRASLKKMLECSKSWDAVIVSDISRITRNGSFFYGFVRELTNKGKEIISASTGENQENYIELMSMLGIYTGEDKK